MNCKENTCCGGCGPTNMIGMEIPAFDLEAYHEDKVKKINLKDYKGQWLILFFYPADFTFVCPTELEDMADHYEEFKKEHAEVLSVSTDTVFVHKAWHDESQAIGKITYPMVADPAGKLARALGVYINDEGLALHDDEGLALRGSFIINPEGKLVSYEVNDNGIGRNAKELLRKLRAAKFVAEHGGKVCPAKWEPGSDTLEPGLDLVGKI